MVNLLAVIIAYSRQSKKPSLNLNDRDLCHFLRGVNQVLFKRLKNRTQLYTVFNSHPAWRIGFLNLGLPFVESKTSSSFEKPSSIHKGMLPICTNDLLYISQKRFTLFVVSCFCLATWELTSFSSAYQLKFYRLIFKKILKIFLKKGLLKYYNLIKIYYLVSKRGFKCLFLMYQI